MQAKRGKFITFEGIEGVGKTTNIVFVAEKLKAAGLPILTTREPGGTGIGEEVREVLLKHRHEPMVPHTELLLMFAARAQHLQQVVLPALKVGKYVISDRFTEASYAYQGGGRGLPLNEIAQLEQLVQSDLRPDITIILDVPVEIGLARARGRGSTDRFEQEQIDFFSRVRQTYLNRANQDPQRYRVIDAAQPLELVQADLAHFFESIIPTMVSP